MKKDVRKVEKDVWFYISQRKKQRDYYTVINSFAVFMCLECPYTALLEANQCNAVNYKNWLVSSKSGATASKYVAILKGLCRSLNDSGALNVNAFALIRVPSKDLNRVRYNRKVADSEVSNLKEVLTNYDRLFAIRDRAILMLLFRSALRVGEVLSIKLADFSGDSLHIKERKNGKSTLLKLSEEQQSIIFDWLAIRGFENGFLFCSTKGKVVRVGVKIDPKTVNLHIGEYCRKAGIPRFTSHSGRVTAVTKALEKGYSYEAVKAMTGHSSITMVERYDRRDAEQIRIEY